MTAPAPHGAHLTILPGPRSGNADFDAACARQDFGLLQAAVAGMTKRDAVEHLAFLFPAHSGRWFSRNFAALMALSPADFERALHPDPTANAAIRRALAA